MNCTYSCGYLATPNYPHIYPIHQHSSWHITVATGTYIMLELGTLEGVQTSLPSCHQDYVEVIDFSFEGEKKSLGTYCISKIPPPVVYSSWHRMTVEFVSDGEFNAGGFMAKYTSASFFVDKPIRYSGKTTFNTIVFKTFHEIMKSSH